MSVSIYPYFDQRFTALAHRGGALLPANIGIENTARAFQNAIDLGYTHIETDVHASADGVLFAFHDSSLSRATDGIGEISGHTAEELQELRVGGTEQIPTLDELFEMFPNTFFNIDMKSDDTVAPLAQLIADHKAQDRVCVASFSHRRLATFRKLTKGAIATSASPLEVAYSALTPLPRLKSANCQAFQIPPFETICGTKIATLTPALIHHAKKQGQKIHVWTIDAPAAMERLIELGVDGIVTDRPDILKEVLVAHNMWEGK